MKRNQKVTVYVHPQLKNNLFDRHQTREVDGIVVVAQESPLIVFGGQQRQAWFQPFDVLGTGDFHLGCIVEAGERPPKVVREIVNKHTGRLVQ